MFRPIDESDSRPLRTRGPARSSHLLPLAGALLLCASCAEPAAPDAVPSPPPVTDTRPVGDGLKVIGFALLGAAVVGALGRLLR